MFKLPDLKKKSIKDLYAIFSATAANMVVGLVRGFFVAKYLGPADFGVLKVSQLFIMLNKFGNLGFLTVAVREIPHFKGTREIEKANETRKVAYSSEFLLSLSMFLVGIFCVFLFDSKFLIILVSVQLFVNKILGIFNTEAIIEKKIALFSKILFWNGLVSSLLVIAAVPFYKIFGVLLFPSLVIIVAIWAYWKSLDCEFKFHINRQELFRQLRIGIPLSLATLSYGSYRYSERILIGSILGVKALGFYGLAAMPLDHMMNFLLLPIRVRKINLYELLGQKKFRQAHRMVVKETAVLCLIALVSIPILWISIDILVTLFLSDYSEAIPISKVLLLAIPIKIISLYPGLVLVSSVVNKQMFIVPVQFSCTAFFVLSVLVLKYFGRASFLNIVIMDVTGYALCQLMYLFLYKRYFMNVYLRVNTPLASGITSEVKDESTIYTLGTEDE